MIYADEDFYKEVYLLGRKPVINAGFSFYARSASQLIDRYTFERVLVMQDIPETVKMCCCELAEAEYRQEKQQKETGGKTSEKIGTYAVNFGSVQEFEAASHKEQYHIIMKWLAASGLCYQGV